MFVCSEFPSVCILDARLTVFLHEFSRLFSVSHPIELHAIRLEVGNSFSPMRKMRPRMEEASNNENAGYSFADLCERSNFHQCMMSFSDQFFEGPNPRHSQNCLS